MTFVFLAKDPVDDLGVFTSSEKAKDACQDLADEYMGLRQRDVLNMLYWRGGDETGWWSAVYYPAAGRNMDFSVIRMTLDERQP